jgi:hypothetical protein
MLIIAKSLIQTALVFSILLAISWGFIGIAVQPFFGIIPVMGFVSLLLTVTYTLWVWDRIPFAATNLYVALCAVRWTADLALMGMSMMLVSVIWCLMWVTAFSGIMEQSDVTSTKSITLFILLVVSFCWTNLVIKVWCNEPVCGKPCVIALTYFFYFRLLEYCTSDSGIRSGPVVVSTRFH